MLGRGKSYRYAYRTKRAISFLFAGLLIVTQINTIREQASVSDDVVGLPQVIDDSDQILEFVGDHQSVPKNKLSRHEATKPIKDKCFSTVAGFDFQRIPSCESLQYFYSSSKFTAFDIQFRKSRDPPDLLA